MICILVAGVFLPLFAASSIFAVQDYRTALYLSTYFYGAQRCGDTQSWAHAACHLKDGQTQGLDLTGGWHDCGDHVTFGQTGPYACGVLIEGYLLYPASYEDRYSQANSAPPSNGIPDVLDEAKIETDFLIKAVNSGTMYYQKGNGDNDHKHMCEPAYYSSNYSVSEGGEEDGPRQMFSVTSGGSNVAGDAAAALALMAIAYQPYDAAYATTCYNKAKEYYAIGDNNPGTVDGQTYYPAANYGDDMAWGGACIYRASLARGAAESTYLTKAQDYAAGGSFSFPTNWALCYDHTEPLAAFELYELTGDNTWKTKMQSEIAAYETKMTTCGIGQYAFITQWGSLRYAANMAFAAILYNKMSGDTAAFTFAKTNIDFILGVHGDISGSPNCPAGRSFMIGYVNPDNTAAGSVQHPHHRSAFGRTTDADTVWQTENSNPGTIPYKYTLYGALVGGPQAGCGTYNDKIDDYVSNEVGVDYNAGLAGALAGIIYVSNPPTPTFTPTFTNTQTPNPLWTATYTFTSTNTATNTPVPPPTHKMNLEVMNSSGTGSCTDQGIKWNVHITNYDTVSIPLSTLTIRVWVNSTAAMTGDNYDSRIYTSGGTSVGQVTTVSFAETQLGQVYTWDGRTTNKYITVTFTGGPDIPANGGYLYIQGDVRRTDYQTFDPSCVDYTQMPSTYAAYTNDSHYTLYEGTDLVCEYLSSTTQDANTGVDPRTGATGCPGMATSTNTPMPPTNTPTRTSTGTPVPPTNTNTATVVPTFTFTGTNTSTNTPQAATSTFTSTSTSTQASFTYTFTATSIPPTNTSTPVPPTFTFTYTAVPSTATPTNTKTAVQTQTYTGTATNTMTPAYTATFTNTPPPGSTATDTPTNTNTATVPAPAQTFTPTVPANTPTDTVVPVFTATDTYTTVPTSSYTATQTKTATIIFPSNTFTFTQTFTTLPADTFTQTPSNSPATVTATPTPVPVATGASFRIDDLLAVPNPVTGAQTLKIRFNMTQKASVIKFRLYTVSFRLIKYSEIKDSNKGLDRGANIISIPGAILSGLSDGTYYYIISGKDLKGTEIRSKADKIIVLK
jgi:endoglucanase